MVCLPTTLCRVMSPRPREPRLWLVDFELDHDERRFVSIACEVPGYPGWRVLPTVASLDNGLELQRLVIEPLDPLHPPAGGIPTRLLRALRTTDLLAALRAARRQAEGLFGPSGLPDLAVTHRVGRQGRSDDFYLGWARAYVVACEGDESGSPTKYLAGLHHVSPSSVSNLIGTARRRGLLTPSPAGRPGGELTAKALALIKEVDRGQ